MAPRVSVIVKFTCSQGRRDEFADSMEALFAQTEAEQGAVVYVLNDDADDPDVLWMYELYADQDAFDAHCSGNEVLAFFPSLGGALMAAPPEIHMMTVRRAKGD